MAEDQSLIGAGAGSSSEHELCVACMYRYRYYGKCSGEFWLCGLSYEDFYYKYRLTEHGTDKEIQLWRSFNPDTDDGELYSQEDDHVILVECRRTYYAARFIADFVSFKSRFILKRKHVQERLADKRWLALSCRRQYYEKEIPLLKRYKQYAKDDLKRINYSIGMIHKDKNYDEEYDDYLYHKRESIRRDLRRYKEEIEHKEEILEEIIEELTILETGFQIGKQTQREKTRAFKQELFMKVFHPDNVEKWLKCGRELEDGEHDSNVLDMMLGC